MLERRCVALCCGVRGAHEGVAVVVYVARVDSVALDLALL